MKKKIYERPQVEITVAKAAGIICTSGYSTESLTEEEYNWTPSN